MDSRATFQKFFNRWVWNTEARSSLEGPGVSLSAKNVTKWLEGHGLITDSAENVTHETALTLSAFWECLQIYTGLAGFFPFQPFYKTDRGRQLAESHPLHDLITKRPDKLTSRNVYFSRAMYHYWVWGNHLAQIVRDGSGKITRLILIHPTHFKEIKQSVNKKGTPGTDLTYVFEKDGKKYTLDKREVIHIPNLGDDISGKGVLKYAREDLGYGQAVRKENSKQFAQGARKMGVLVADRDLSEQQMNDIISMHNKQKQQGGTMVLPAGFSFSDTSMSPEDMQFLQAGKFSAETVARWFGVPLGFLQIMGDQTYNNFEAAGIAFLQNHVGPHFAKFEAEYTFKTFDQEKEKNYYWEYNLDSYLRADAKTQAEMFRTGIQNGYYKINEVRRYKNLNEIDGGDRAFIQQNMMPIDKVDDIVLRNKENGQTVRMENGQS